LHIFKILIVILFSFVENLIFWKNTLMNLQ